MPWRGGRSPLRAWAKVQIARSVFLSRSIQVDCGNHGDAVWELVPRFTSMTPMENYDGTMQIFLEFGRIPLVASAMVQLAEWLPQRLDNGRTIQVRCFPKPPLPMQVLSHLERLTSRCAWLSRGSVPAPSRLPSRRFLVMSFGELLSCV